MSKIWLLLLISSISTLLFINPSMAITAMVKGSSEAVTLAMTLVALYGFWLGFFAILEKIGIADFIAKILRPLVRFLFKGVKPETEKYISMNMSANILGLGNASTPMGIKAINSMNDGSPYATTNMIMLIVISATSLQLLPSTVIGMRATHGSLNPTDFLIPTTVATIVSTILGIFLVKLISKFLPDKKKKEKEADTVSPLPLKGGAKL